MLAVFGVTACYKNQKGRALYEKYQYFKNRKKDNKENCVELAKLRTYLPDDKVMKKRKKR